MGRSPRLCRQALLVPNLNPSIRLSLCRFLFTCCPVSVLCSYVWARVENTSIMQCASFGASLAVQHFSTLFHKTTIKKKLLKVKCVFFIFSTNFYLKIFLILRRIQRDIVINVKTSSCKVLLFMYDFN
jgi:hypothetical protein